MIKKNPRGKKEKYIVFYTLPYGDRSTVKGHVCNYWTTKRARHVVFDLLTREFISYLES